MTRSHTIRNKTHVSRRPWAGHLAALVPMSSVTMGVTAIPA